VSWYRNKGKYNAKKTIAFGITFDSKKEAQRYQELKIMEAAGEIKGLKRQVKFQLIPPQYEPDTVGKRGGKIKGKLIERECAYYADFTYFQNGVFIVEDTKGMKTPDYIIKRKLMLHVNGIRIKEI
jgi:hypothetical protein